MTIGHWLHNGKAALQSAPSKIAMCVETKKKNKFICLHALASGCIVLLAALLVDYSFAIQSRQFTELLFSLRCLVYDSLLRDYQKLKIMLLKLVSINFGEVLFSPALLHNASLFIDQLLGN